MIVDKIELVWGGGHSDGLIDLRNGKFFTAEDIFREVVYPVKNIPYECVYKTESRTGLSGKAVIVKKPYFKKVKYSYNIRSGNSLVFLKEGGCYLTAKDMADEKVITLLPNRKYKEEGGWDYPSDKEAIIRIFKRGDEYLFTQMNFETESVLWSRGAEKTFKFYTEPGILRVIKYKTDLAGFKYRWAINVFFENACIDLVEKSLFRYAYDENVPLLEGKGGCYYWTAPNELPIIRLGDKLPSEYGNFVFPDRDSYYILNGDKIIFYTRNYKNNCFINSEIVQEEFFKKPISFWKDITMAFQDNDILLSLMKQNKKILTADYAISKGVCKSGVDSFIKKYEIGGAVGISLNELSEHPSIKEMFEQSMFRRVVINLLVEG